MERSTTDHEAIKKWAEKYKGRPERIDDPTSGADQVSVRIGFREPQRGLEITPDDLQPIEWDEFFEEFERLELSFVYQDPVPEGVRPIDVYQLLPRGTESSQPEQDTDNANVQRE